MISDKHLAKCIQFEAIMMKTELWLKSIPYIHFSHFLKMHDIGFLPKPSDGQG